MATYPEIKQWVFDNFNIKIHHPCWIAHCKKMAGISIEPSPNRIGHSRKIPCPPAKRQAIFAAFKHFKMV